ncbi:MAG TPA: ABC transporter permease [Tepiditoga sp.]|nr:ABC transporter permease [Thermotogota bacterium]HOO74315.1 ABC transporter permease [Tepiditoga sp.]
MYWKYALKRILIAIIVFIVIIFIFSLLFNKVAETTLKGQIDEIVKAEVLSMSKNNRNIDIGEYRKSRLEFYYKKYHMNDSYVEKVFWRTYDTVTFNFGRATNMKSSRGSDKVVDIIAEALPRTLILFTVAIIIEIILGIWIGLKKAQKAGGAMDKSTSVATMIVFGMPSWWLGMIMIMFFAYVLKLFPSGGMHSVPTPEGFAYFLDYVYHLILPVFTLVLLGFWGNAFLTRNIVLGTLQEDFIMSARARGIPEKNILFGHTLRTSAPPIITMALLSLLGSIGGNLVFEGIFSWRGMGNLYWSAVQSNDIPVLIGNLAVTTGIYMIGLVILDLIYGFLDPRIKVGG